MLKTCSLCGQIKEQTEFYEDKRIKSGYFARCKICSNSESRKSHRKGKPVDSLRKSKKGDYSLLSNTDRAYMAGLFDGEGCIIIALEKPNPTRKNTKYFSFRLQISLVSVDKVITDWVNNKFKSRVVVTEKIEKARKRYTWVATSFIAYDILKEFMDFLVLKKERAELAIKFQELSFISENGNTLEQKDEIRKIKSEIRDKIQSLNRRESCVS